MNNRIQDLTDAPTFLGGIFDYDAKKSVWKETPSWNSQDNGTNLSARAGAWGKTFIAQAIVDTLDQMIRGWTTFPGCAELCGKKLTTKRRLTSRHLELKYAGREAGAVGIPSDVLRRYDSADYLDIQAGSGGTEAQDWASLCLRMWHTVGREARGFKTEVVKSPEGSRRH